jgi:cytoskeletal protein CcmA (bactofilin family)
MRRVFPPVLLVVLLAWPANALAQPSGTVVPRDQIVLSGDVSVPKGHAIGEVVVFSGTVTVSGVVEGDVVVLEGPVTVSGQVSGSVVAVDGRVTLRSTAQVAGDVLAGGTVSRADGAQVGGQVRSGVRFSLARSVSALGALLVSFAMAVSILMAAGLLVLVAPGGAERVATAARTAPAPSALWGLLLGASLPIGAVLLAATVLGIPFGLSLLLGLGLVWLVGQAWATWSLGRLIVREPRSRTGALFAGWAAGAAVGLVPGLNLVWWTLGSLFGLGAMLVATWRVRRGATASGGRAPGAMPRRAGAHRAGRSTTMPVASPGAGLPETPLGED